MAPRALLVWGIVLALVAVALAAWGNAVRGPANPECAGVASFGCGGAYLAGALVQLLALPAGVAAGTLIAIWLGRRAQAEEDPHER